MGKLLTISFCQHSLFLSVFMLQLQLFLKDVVIERKQISGPELSWSFLTQNQCWLASAGKIGINTFRDNKLKIFSHVVDIMSIKLYRGTMVWILNIRKHIIDQQLDYSLSENASDQKLHFCPSLTDLFQMPLVASYKTFVMAERGRGGKKAFRKILA